MPVYYKWPAYIGNVLLALCGLIIVFANSVPGGAAVIALAGLNLFLVRKLDIFSQEEVWLALEIKKVKMREELRALQEKEAEESDEPDKSKPPQLSGPQSTK